MFENKERTDLAELGEFGLIDHLTSNFKIRHQTSVKGIGDDAAVLNFFNSFQRKFARQTNRKSDLCCNAIHSINIA